MEDLGLDKNTYFTSLMNPSTGPQVDIPDDSCEQTVLRRLVLSETITVPDGLTDVQLMFIWVPRARVSQIFVYLYVGDSGGGTAKWAFLKVINYELSLVDYFRLFRVVSGDLVIQSGTVATTLAPLSGFVNAVQTVGLPELLRITTPSQLISSRRSENGFMSQGRLVDGMVALVQPSGLLDSGFVQPDDPFVPLDWPVSLPSALRQPEPSDSSYYRCGRFTVEQTDEAVQVAVGPADPGWETANINEDALGTLWDSGESNVALFPLSVMGEIEIDYCFDLVWNVDPGAPAGSADVNLLLIFAFYCDRVKPSDWTVVDTAYDSALVALNTNVVTANSGSDQVISGKLRFRPTGLVRQMKVLAQWHTNDGPTPSVMVLRQYRETRVSDDEPACVVNRLNYRMVDMTTKGGWNASNIVAIVSGLSAGQVVQVTSRMNVAAIPNQENAPILKGRLTIPDATSVRVARVVLAGSPVFRGIYNVAGYQAMLAELTKAGHLSNDTLMQHAFDFGDLLHGIGKVAGAIGPAISGVVSTFNPAAGAIVGGISNLLSNARDRRRRAARKGKAKEKDDVGEAPLVATARDGRVLARDARGLARDAGPMAVDRGVKVYAAPKLMNAAPRQLGRVQHFLAVSETAAGGEVGVEVHEWAVTCELYSGEDATRTLGHGPTFWLQDDKKRARGGAFGLQFNIDVDLTMAQDLLEVAYAVVPLEVEIARFQMRCTRSETGIAGHSWHAAALACLLGVPTGLWTGSPLTPAGGLVEKLSAAFALGKVLRVLGDTEREVLARWQDTGIRATRPVAMVGEEATVALVLPRELFGMFNVSSARATAAEAARMLRYIFAHAYVTERPTSMGLVRISVPVADGAGWRFVPEASRGALVRWKEALKDPKFVRALSDQSSCLHTLMVMLQNLPLKASLAASQVCAELAHKLEVLYAAGVASAPTQSPQKESGRSGVDGRRPRAT